MNSTTHVIKYSLSSYLISIVFIMMFVPLEKKKGSYAWCYVRCIIVLTFHFNNFRLISNFVTLISLVRIKRFIAYRSTQDIYITHNMLLQEVKDIYTDHSVNSLLHFQCIQLKMYGVFKHARSC